MAPETVALFLVLLLLGGMGGLIASAVVPSIRSAIDDVALPLGVMVAVGATAGSLYFSEIANFVPCELCWFQRIAMYPLAIILPLAAIRRDVSVLPYVQALAVIGLGIALYHSQLQAFPDQGSFCALDNPCTSSPIKTLGWITIPHMSALSFVLVFVLASHAKRRFSKPINRGSL